MVFIPQKLNLKQAYKYIDTLFNNWFTKSGVPLDWIIYYFPNIATFTTDEILYGMLWVYYNYIIDWLNMKYPNRLGDVSGVRFINLFHLKCFLKGSKLSDEEIKAFLVKIGTPPDLLKSIMEATGKVDMSTFVKTYPSSPFNDKRVLQLFKQRQTSKTMFQDDKELLVIMDTKIANIIKILREKKEAVREKLRQEAVQKAKKLKMGHGVVKEMLFSEESATGERVPHKLALKKKGVVETSEEIAAKEKRREKILKKHKSKIVKGRAEEGDESEEDDDESVEEDVEFKPYTGKFLY